MAWYTGTCAHPRVHTCVWASPARTLQKSSGLVFIVRQNYLVTATRSGASFLAAPSNLRHQSHRWSNHVAHVLNIKPRARVYIIKVS